MKANIKYLVIGALAAMVNTAYADMSKTATGALVGATACGLAGAAVNGGDSALKAGVACAAVGAGVGSRNDRTNAIEDLADNRNSKGNGATVIHTNKNNNIIDSKGKNNKPVKKAKREVQKEIIKNY